MNEEIYKQLGIPKRVFEGAGVDSNLTSTLWEKRQQLKEEKYRKHFNEKVIKPFLNRVYSQILKEYENECRQQWIEMTTDIGGEG
jgi:hypothetical protein